VPLRIVSIFTTALGLAIVILAVKFLAGSRGWADIVSGVDPTTRLPALNSELLGRMRLLTSTQGIAGLLSGVSGVAMALKKYWAPLVALLSATLLVAFPLFTKTFFSYGRTSFSEICVACVIGILGLLGFAFRFRQNRHLTIGSSDRGSRLR
jgi:1,4-dihydroxy-2-naphthoate octaprenyltransferase